MKLFLPCNEHLRVFRIPAEIHSWRGWTVRPYLFVRQGDSAVPIWLEPVPDEPHIHHHYASDYVMHQFLFGKPADAFQTMEYWASLPVKGSVKDLLLYEAKCVGIHHLLETNQLKDETSDDGHGQAVIWLANANGHLLFGAWADSKQAAERYIKSL